MKKFAVLMILTVLLANCGDDDDSTNVNKPDKLIYKDLFEHQSNPFYEKIPAKPEIDPQSAGYVKKLEKAYQEGGFYLAQKKWSVPVYYAGPATKGQDVKLTVSWAQFKYLKNVPIPDYAEPDPENDGEMTVIDTIGGCMYDFWQVKNTNNGWKASWANALPIGSNGIFEKGMSCRGAGFALLLGLIWPQEITAGSIDHALEFTYNYTQSGGPVWPATESDGTSKISDALPEGARLQLNPYLDLDSLNLTGYEKIVAKALQEYGMILGDDGGGGIELEVIHPLSVKNNPWAGILPVADYVYIEKIPMDQFRVLKLPAQTNPETEVVQNACNLFE